MARNCFVFVLLVSVLVKECVPCSQPTNWAHQTVEQRAAMAHRIVYATDVRHLNIAQNHLGSSYSVQFDVLCVLKGAPFQSNPVTVADMGLIPHLCTAHVVKEGRTYFMFLMGSEEEVVTIHEVNYEIGVFEDHDGYREIFDREFGFYSRCFGMSTTVQVNTTTEPTLVTTTVHTTPARTATQHVDLNMTTQPDTTTVIAEVKGPVTSPVTSTAPPRMISWGFIVAMATLIVVVWK